MTQHFLGLPGGTGEQDETRHTLVTQRQGVERALAVTRDHDPLGVDLRASCERGERGAGVAEVVGEAGPEEVAGARPGAALVVAEGGEAGVGKGLRE